MEKEPVKKVVFKRWKEVQRCQVARKKEVKRETRSRWERKQEVERAFGRLKGCRFGVVGDETSGRGPTGV
jgi:hypothetical protein